jgi:hypothetical protein
MASKPKTLIAVGTFKELKTGGVYSTVEVWGVPAPPIPTELEYRAIESGKVLFLNEEDIMSVKTLPESDLKAYKPQTTPEGKMVSEPKAEGKGFFDKLFGSDDDDHENCSCKDEKDASKETPCPCKGWSGKKIAAVGTIIVGICLVLYFIIPTFAADKALAA